MSVITPLATKLSILSSRGFEARIRLWPEIPMCSIRFCDHSVSTTTGLYCRPPSPEPRVLMIELPRWLTLSSKPQPWALATSELPIYAQEYRSKSPSVRKGLVTRQGTTIGTNTTPSSHTLSLSLPLRTETVPKNRFLDAMNLSGAEYIPVCSLHDLLPSHAFSHELRTPSHARCNLGRTNGR